MGEKIRIKAGNIEMIADLLENSKTAQAICDALPLEGRANRWGKEIYFHIPVEFELENGQETVGLGDLGYWPQGNAFCVFFGPTPMSQGDEIRPASAVNVFGRIIGDPRKLEKVTPGTTVLVTTEE